MLKKLKQIRIRQSPEEWEALAVAKEAEIPNVHSSFEVSYLKDIAAQYRECAQKEVALRAEESSKRRSRKRKHGKDH